MSSSLPVTDFRRISCFSISPLMPLPLRRDFDAAIIAAMPLLPLLMMLSCFSAAMPLIFAIFHDFAAIISRHAC